MSALTPVERAAAAIERCVEIFDTTFQDDARVAFLSIDVDELARVIDRADDDWQHGIGASGTTWDRAIAHAVRDYLTGNESDESHE